MAKATDVATLQAQVAQLVAIIQALITYAGDYPPQDDWHAAKKQAMADAKTFIASVQ